MGTLLAVPWLSPAPIWGVSWEPAHRHLPRPAPAVPVGAGLQGMMDSGRANGARQGQQRWGLEPLQRGQQLGQAVLLVAKMGSQLPG